MHRESLTRPGRWGFVLFVGFLALSISPARAQDLPLRQSGRGGDPIERTLTTKDGVLIKISYYPGREGQETTPVLLLHDLNESRVAYDRLARIIQDPRIVGVEQSKTRAVVTVDLRGHGESKTAIGLDGRTYTLEAARFRAIDFSDMVLFDLEIVRQFLIEENDAGALNINKLCVVGAGMGANVAVAWAARDWSMPPLAVRKQGQDIKGLVLISPTWDFPGLPLANPIRQPDVQREISFLLTYGAEFSSAKADAKKILDSLEQFHPEPPPERQIELKTLFHLPLETELQGSKLITREQFGVGPAIDVFIRNRLDEKAFGWTKRLLE